MKQITMGMDQLESKHYESKVALLDKKIAEVQESGEPVKMDQLIVGVGLSTKLKETKAVINPEENKTTVDPAQVIKQRRATERNKIN